MHRSTINHASRITFHGPSPKLLPSQCRDPRLTTQNPMKVVKFDDAERYEPDAGWMRVALAGSDRFSFEWFEKPPGHSSPMHHHENEQVCVCLDGRLVVQFEDERVELGPYDSV